MSQDINETVKFFSFLSQLRGRSLNSWLTNVDVFFVCSKSWNNNFTFANFEFQLFKYWMSREVMDGCIRLAMCVESTEDRCWISRMVLTLLHKETKQQDLHHNLYQVDFTYCMKLTVIPNRQIRSSSFFFDIKSILCKEVKHVNLAEVWYLSAALCICHVVCPMTADLFKPISDDQTDVQTDKPRNTSTNSHFSAMVLPLPIYQACPSQVNILQSTQSTIISHPLLIYDQHKSMWHFILNYMILFYFFLVFRKNMKAYMDNLKQWLCCITQYYAIINSKCMHHTKVSF